MVTVLTPESMVGVFDKGTCRRSMNLVVLYESGLL